MFLHTFIIDLPQEYLRIKLMDYLFLLTDDFKDKSSKFSLWYDYARPTHPDIHQVISDLILESVHDSIHSHRPIIDDMKLKKSPAEQKLVRETCNIAAQSLKEVIQFAKPGEFMCEIQTRIMSQSLMPLNPKLPTH